MSSIGTGVRRGEGWGIKSIACPMSHPSVNRVVSSTGMSMAGHKYSGTRKRKNLLKKIVNTLIGEML